MTTNNDFLSAVFVLLWFGQHLTNIFKLQLKISKFSFHRSDPTVYKHCSVELANVYKSLWSCEFIYTTWWSRWRTGQLISSRKPEAKEVRSQRWWTQRLQLQCVQCTRTNNVKQWADRQKQMRNIECVGERRVESREPFKQDEWLSRVRAGHMSTVSPRMKIMIIINSFIVTQPNLNELIINKLKLSPY